MRFARLLSTAALVGSLALTTGCTPEQPPVSDKVAAAYEQGKTLQPRVDPTIYFAFGDSYTGGSDMGGGRGTPENWVSRVSNQLRPEVPDLVTAERGLGGSGYVAVGPSGIVFADEVRKSLTPEADLVSIFGSINDKNVPPAEVAQAADTLLADVKKIAPDAKVVVIGPAWMNADVPDNILEIRNALSDAAERRGAAWVDPISDRWFFDRTDLIGEDGVHPTNDGHAYMAERIAPHLAAALKN